MADWGRRSSVPLLGEPRISDGELLTRLDLSSESILERLLFLERIDGLRKVVLGSPLIRNKDGGSSSFCSNSPRNVLSTVLERVTVVGLCIKRDCISLAHLSKQYGSSPWGRNSSVDPMALPLDPSFDGTSLLLRRNFRDDDDEDEWCSGVSEPRRLMTSVGKTGDFFLFAATSPI